MIYMVGQVSNCASQLETLPYKLWKTIIILWEEL